MSSASSAARRSRSPVGSSHRIKAGSVTIAPRDADALLLPARHLPRIMPRPVAEPDEAEHRFHPGAPLGLRERAQEQRQLDILGRIQHRHQIVELEDDPERLRAPSAPGRRRSWR